MKIKKLLLLFFLYLPLSSFSQDFKWSEIFNSGDISILIDTQRIKKIDGNLRVWVLQNYQTPRQNGYFTYQSMIEYQEINCKEDKTLQLKQTQFTGLSGTGSVLELPTDGKWNFNSPNTRFDITLKHLCNLKFKY